MSDPEAHEPSPAFLGALANEQFGLQSVSGISVSESSSRAALYLSTLSSGLVAIGFSATHPTALAALTFSVLPTVFILGCFTIVRLVDTSVENLVALRRLERVRQYWATLDPAGAHFFGPDAPRSGYRGVRYGFWAMLFTMASMIVFVNGVLAGAIAALLLAIAAGASTAVFLTVGIAVGAVAVVVGLVYENRRLVPWISGLSSDTAAGDAALPGS